MQPGQSKGITKDIKIITYLALALSIASVGVLGALTMQLYGMNRSIAKSTNTTAASVGQASSLPQEFQKRPIMYVIPWKMLTDEVLPNGGLQLPVHFGNSIQALVQESALNASFLKQVMKQTGENFSSYEENVLNGAQNENIVVNASDSYFILDVLWAVGVNNNNTIINRGAIMKSGHPDNFASTGAYGGLGKLSLGKLNLLTLTPGQQIIAEQVAGNTYRPCCDNPTAFPDCNHGAAALGLIELMASQGFNATTISGAVKQFESFYFSQNFFTEAVYFYATQGLLWTQVPSEPAISYFYSSQTGSGYMQQYLVEYVLGNNEK